MNDIFYYIWLSIVCGAGSSAGDTLLERYGSARAVYEADPKEIAADKSLSLPEGTAERLAHKAPERIEKILEYCARNNVSVISCDDAIYPSRLRNMRAFPAVLYYKGRFIDFDDNLCVGMVGTRKATDYGRHAAYDLAKDMASCGTVVVSGMASGIDSASHKGCIFAGGFTAAVLGCGIDVCYPPENRVLMDKIIETGCLLTDRKSVV